MKTLILAVTFSISSLVVLAQNPHPHFGLKAGLNIADLKVENGADLDPRASFYIGGLAHIHMTRNFALQPELYFSSQGAKSDDPDYSINLNYINLPILVQYMTGTGFRLQTGPQIGALLSAKQKLGSTSTNMKDDFNSIDFSWAFGAGFVSNSGLGIDARYNLGLNDIAEGNSKVQNRVLSIGLFYQFGVSDARRTARN